MKINDFLNMLVNADEEGQEVMCAVVEDENYCLPSGFVENGKDGTFYKGFHFDMPYEITEMNFSKWDLVGNVFVFILNQ